ncbi:RTA1-domain-containing protein [Irpex rosettiformis]|uniref:RTA1-domain-containing protein n=1 Tax=Irpex rosettiformis TaxID=378272 RepID=A0ACB8UGR8_9APHY|nr:RTA1-domain-containing protein [Irpex rosettiformis]
MSTNATDGDPTATVPAPGYFNSSPYNYIPTEWICALYIALFSLSGIIHLGQALYTRLWFLLPTVVLAISGEILGWIARLWSSRNPNLINPFLMQISTTIIAPTPLVAANFVILGELIRRMGPQYSRLSPMWYTIIFCSCDIIALVIQAVGGASASSAADNGKDPDVGGHIMLGGIVFQMAAITVYVALAAEFVLRFSYDWPVRKVESETNPKRFVDQKTKLMLLGLGLSSLFIFIRSVYRTIELSDGWGGQIISTQVLFNVLDGAMITLAVFTINIFHPGFLLGNGHEWRRQRGIDSGSNSVDEITITPEQEAKK